jgi:hypothetical protein
MTNFISWPLQMKSASGVGCNASGSAAIYTVINISSTSGHFVVGSCDISFSFPVLTVGETHIPWRQITETHIMIL